MNLVLVGRHSLEDLEKYATENFSGVEDRNLPKPNFKDEKVHDSESTFQKICQIIPSKDIKSLSLYWELPPTSTFCRAKSSRYLSHVIGHEGPNSLLSHLIKESLATSLSSGANGRLNHAIEEFYVSISLTKKGE